MDHQDEIGENLLSEQHLQVKVPPLKYTSETQKINQSATYTCLSATWLTYGERDL